MEADQGFKREKRIAKNTLLLYVRMLFLLLVSLFTTRIVLSALGIVDSGIFNAVGSSVAIFSVLSGSLSAAISRFLTYELGKNEKGDRLSRIFSSSVTIQLIIAVAVIILAEALAPWFISHKMTIPSDRMAATQWVFQFSLLSFAINLISVPYNAAIISHERMGAFAFIGIFEGLAKLGVALLISIAPMDKLIWYALLMCLVALAVRLAYGLYCRKNFEECRSKLHFDPVLFRQMFSFAGWNFIGASSAALRDQGGNILINVFCGPAVNAARMVAMQLSGAVQSFVTNFMTALNPQITKSYASGERDFMMKLVFKGAKFSFFLLIIIGLPILMNTEFLMGIWLKEVPEHAVNFVKLAIIFAMSESLSNPLVTAMLATGDIKKYQIIVGGIQLLNLPVSWLLLSVCHAAPESVLMVAVALSQLALFARLILMKDMVGLPVGKYLLQVYLPVLVTMLLSLALPMSLQHLLHYGWLGFFESCAICVLWSAAVILLIGRPFKNSKMYFLHPDI